MNRSEVWTRALAGALASDSYLPFATETADRALALFDERFRGGGSDREDSATPARSDLTSLIEHLNTIFDGFMHDPAASTWSRAYLCALLDLVAEQGLPRHPHYAELRQQIRNT